MQLRIYKLNLMQILRFPSPTLVDKAKTYDYGYKVAESVTAQLTKQYESKLKTAAIKFQDKLHEKTCKSVGLEITVLARAGRMTNWLQKSGFNRKAVRFWKYKIAAKWGTSKDFAAWKHHKIYPRRDCVGSKPQWEEGKRGQRKRKNSKSRKRPEQGKRQPQRGL